MLLYIHQQDQFDYLFGRTYIGQHPTKYRNSYLVLHLDFSTIDPTGSLAEIEGQFNLFCHLKINLTLRQSKAWLANKIQVDRTLSAAANLRLLLDEILFGDLPQLYVIIDEYDNFTNQLVRANKDTIYHQLMADDSFFKTSFKTLKEGRKTGAIANVFITGVLPITMDDLASGFNVGAYITLDPNFEAMLGFTQTEVDTLLDQIYLDYQIDPATRDEVGAVIKNHYNGYQFVKNSQIAIYNSTILMFFLDKFYRYQTIPDHLTDLNLRPI